MKTDGWGVEPADHISSLISNRHKVTAAEYGQPVMFYAAGRYRIDPQNSREPSKRTIKTDKHPFYLRSSFGSNLKLSKKRLPCFSASEDLQSFFLPRSLHARW